MGRGAARARLSLASYAYVTKRRPTLKARIPAISLRSHRKFAPPPFDMNAAKGQLFNSPIWSN